MVSAQFTFMFWPLKIVYKYIFGPVKTEKFITLLLLNLTQFFVTRQAAPCQVPGSYLFRNNPYDHVIEYVI